MLVQSRLKSPRLHHHHPVLPGPGIEGDYFEIKNETQLIQKLNAIFSQQMTIPPLLPSRKNSEKTLDSNDDDPEKFLLSSLKDEAARRKGVSMIKNKVHSSADRKGHGIMTVSIINTEKQEQQQPLKAPSSPSSSSSPISVCKFPNDIDSDHHDFNKSKMLDTDNNPFIMTTTSTPPPTISPSSSLTDHDGHGHDDHIHPHSPASTSMSPTSMLSRGDLSEGLKSSGQKTTATSKTVKRKNDENQKLQEQQLQKQNPSSSNNNNVENSNNMNTGLQLKTKLQELLKKKGNQVDPSQQEEQNFNQNYHPQPTLSTNPSKSKKQHQQPIKNSHSNKQEADDDSPIYYNNGKKIVLRRPRSASFSSSIHEDEDDGYNKEGKNCIDVTVPQHYSNFSIRCSSSFSSSIHDYDDEEEVKARNDLLQNDHDANTKDQTNKNIHLLNKVEMFQKFQTHDELQDFKRINNFTAEGDYLLTKILRERSRIQLKKDMLKSERDLYVNVQKNCRERSGGGNGNRGNVDEERKVLFYC